jgi:glycosyltransferase involved in cell wall biosynthesis
MVKKKLLFIVSDFYHNGAQREMYEFDNALDKNKFEVTILSLIGLNTRIDLTDYFYEKHLEMNSKIIFFKDIIREPKKGLNFRIINKVLRNLLNEKVKNNNSRSLLSLFSKYDKVVFMGEYVYQYLSSFIKNYSLKETFIFVMCSRFQSENYRDFNKDKKYVFFSGFDDMEQISFEFEGFKDYKHIYKPLGLMVSGESSKWKFKDDNTLKKIGIFTRLHKDKPLDPFLYAYKVLLSQGINIELNIFGVGDYKQAGYDRYINHLDLEGRVHFKGHQSDMKQTIIDEKLDLVWFQGYKNRPAGYAGFEVCLTGVPQLFWDFFVGQNKQINNLDVVYPHYKDLLSFVEATKTILSDKKMADILSERQFNDVVNNRDISKNIKAIENIFLEE